MFNQEGYVLTTDSIYDNVNGIHFYRVPSICLSQNFDASIKVGVFQQNWEFAIVKVPSNRHFQSEISRRD